MSTRNWFSTPWPPRIVRQAKIRTRMLDHSGTTTARNSSVRHFGAATRAMNHASGKRERDVDQRDDRGEPHRAPVDAQPQAVLAR